MTPHPVSLEVGGGWRLTLIEVSPSGGQVRLTFQPAAGRAVRAWFDLERGRVADPLPFTLAPAPERAVAGLVRARLPRPGAELPAEVVEARRGLPGLQAALAALAAGGEPAAKRAAREAAQAAVALALALARLERASAPDAEPWALLLEDGTAVPVGAARFLIGRGSHCELVVKNPRASRENTLLSLERDGLWAEDLGSSNGTHVDGRRIQRQRLADGQELQIGDDFRVWVAGPPED